MGAARPLTPGQRGGAENAGRRLTVLRAIDKLDRLGPDGVRALLGEGRKDESGDFTKGAGLTPAATDRVLAYTQARAGDNSATLDALDAAVAGAGAGEAGVVELRYAPGDEVSPFHVSEDK